MFSLGFKKYALKIVVDLIKNLLNIIEKSKYQLVVVLLRTNLFSFSVVHT